MSVPVPSRTASPLAFFIHFNQSKRSSGKQAYAMSPLLLGIAPFPLRLPHLCGGKLLFARKGSPLLEKMPSLWKVHLVIKVPAAGAIVASYTEADVIKLRE